MVDVQWETRRLPYHTSPSTRYACRFVTLFFEPLVEEKENKQSVDRILVIRLDIRLWYYPISDLESNFQFPISDFRACFHASHWRKKNQKSEIRRKLPGILPVWRLDFQRFVRPRFSHYDTQSLYTVCHAMRHEYYLYSMIILIIWLVGTNLGLLYSIAQVAWNASWPFKFEMEGHDAFQVTWAID